MLKAVIFILILAVIAGCVALCFDCPFAGMIETHASNKSILDFKMRDIDGKEVNLKTYKGNVLLVVNTASKCGLTPQYESLQATYDKYEDRGFSILGFPANNFGAQEPGTEAEIKELCTTRYKVTFPMFAKISVKGEDQHPLYRFLTAKETNPDFAGDIKWNFSKFLVDRKGKVVARFEPKVKPDSDEINAAIEKYLAAK